MRRESHAKSNAVPLGDRGDEREEDMSKQVGMEPKILTALKGSIDKWQKIIDGKGEDRGGDDCSLCRDIEDSCDGCPVKKKTGYSQCHGSPYWDWFNHHLTRHEGYFQRSNRCSICKRLAQKELDFLKSLLPKNERQRRTP